MSKADHHILDNKDPHILEDDGKALHASASGPVPISSAPVVAHQQQNGGTPGLTPPPPVPVSSAPIIAHGQLAPPPGQEGPGLIDYRELERKRKSRRWVALHFVRHPCNLQAICHARNQVLLAVGLGGFTFVAVVAAYSVILFA